VTHLVDRQVAAYNARDIEAFVACFAWDVELVDGNGNTVMTGREEMRVRYGAMFERHPDLHAEVLTRIEVGPWTIDHERTTAGGRTMEAAVAYLVRDGLIVRSILMPPLED